jgi:hypothetical protein
MLIPEPEQRRLWGSRTYFTTGSGFNLSAAVRERDRLWERYLQTFTSRKEAQSANPRLVDYEVSLDLGLFCAYGRAVADLTAR